MKQNHSSILAVENSKLRGLVKPLYDSYCFLGIPGTIEKVLTGSTELPTLPADTLKKESYDKVVLILLDAFGWNMFDKHLNDNNKYPELNSRGYASQLTSMFPSATPGLIATLNTGQTIPQHGLYASKVYNPKIEDVIAPLSDITYYGKETLESVGLTPEEIYPQNDFYNRLKEKGITSHYFQHKSIFGPPYDNALREGAKKHKERTMTSLFTNLAKQIESSEKGSYLYAYVDNIDTISHYFSADSDQASNEIGSLLRAIEGIIMPSVDDNTLLIITADHGHSERSVENYVNLEEYSSLLRKNSRGETIKPAGTHKTPMLQIAQGMKEEALAIFREDFKDIAEVFDMKEVLSLKLFGPGEYSDEFIATLGDILLIPKDGASIWWGEMNAKVSGHGGLTASQMEIPFIVV